MHETQGSVDEMNWYSVNKNKNAIPAFKHLKNPVSMHRFVWMKLACSYKYTEKTSNLFKSEVVFVSYWVKHSERTKTDYFSALFKKFPSLFHFTQSFRSKI